MHSRFLLSLARAVPHRLTWFAGLGFNYMSFAVSTDDVLHYVLFNEASSSGGVTAAVPCSSVGEILRDRKKEVKRVCRLATPHRSESSSRYPDITYSNLHSCLPLLESVGLRKYKHSGRENVF